MLPDFLVIGGQRCGTTWLDLQMRHHPHIVMPKDRKEVHFFTRNYDRGIDWYKKLFVKPTTSEASELKFGEVTPKYIFDPQAPERIHEHLPNAKLIAILRNPADRAYSQFGLSVRNWGFSGSFSDYLENDKEVFPRGLYSEQLDRYLNRFDRKQILVLIFEEVMADKPKAMKQIFEFLEMDATRFPESVEVEQRNISYMPKHAKAYTAVLKVVRWLRHNNLYWVFNAGKKLGLSRKIFGVKSKMPPIPADLRATLLRKYETDISRLEDQFGLNLEAWRKEKPTSLKQSP